MLDFAHSPSRQKALTRRNHLFYRHLNPSRHTAETSYYEALMHKAGLAQIRLLKISQTKKREVNTTSLFRFDTHKSGYLLLISGN